ncbi:MAG TPA: ATP-binding protein [Verrucomicrobiae bacterium]|nr:ATP-binding protein [Verrucomicrobiae bacterium]
MTSIRARLLLAASTVLLTFVALCGAALETAFRDSARGAQEERLRGLTYALLGAAEPDEKNELSLNDANLPEPRLGQPQSGLEAAILDEAGTTLWHSPSVDGEPPVVIGPEVGKWKFERLGESGPFALSFGLRWLGDQPRRYTVLVLESPEAYEAQLSIFRHTLWTYLFAGSIVLLLALLLVMRWGLAPLRRLEGELREVETGAAPQVGARYPAELTPLTSALNAMIVGERSQLQRYRHALGDLAHSLKTPLAVLRGLAGDARLADEPRRQLDEQVGRMQSIADHQLARAATAGRRTLAQPINVRPIADKLVAALAKVYADKNLVFSVEMPDGLTARADSGDLYELLGNVLDNAAKWARSRVSLAVAREGNALLLVAEDDGPGFPDDAEHLLGRGVRADTRVPGQGLGLASVVEVLSAYEGRIALERSAALGGARVTIRIPAA